MSTRENKHSMDLQSMLNVFQKTLNKTSRCDIEYSFISDFAQELETVIDLCEGLNMLDHSSEFF